MVVLAMCVLVSVPEVPDGVVYRGDTVVSVAEMLDALHGADIVFVGEKHDDPLAHQWELFLWQSLASDDRALALEMIEEDVQPVLDAFLAGETTEEEFLAQSRPWGNYTSDYAPMVDFAKQNGYGVIAANVPRPYAARVVREGLAAVLEDSLFHGLGVDSSNTAYRERFLATMESIGDQMHGMPVDNENIYLAQLLKDAVMARSVSGKKVLFVCGAFHSDFHSGIPDQLPADADYLTVTVLGEGEEFSPDLADFVIVRK